MKKSDNIRIYAWLEFAIWLLIASFIIFGFRYNHYKAQQQYKNYQIFMNDVDGLIVGSPVRFLGVQIGYVKKIQIIYSEVYVKFAITQKGLTIPVGSTATVEGSGLGGSKSLEIYPPTENISSDKIILTKDPTRIGKIVGLFKDMFINLDAIITNINYASNEVQEDIYKIPENIIMPVDNSLKGLRKEIDYYIKYEQSLKKKNGGNNESGQSKDNN